MGHLRAGIERHKLDETIHNCGVKNVRHHAQVELVAAADVESVVAL